MRDRSLTKIGSLDSTSVRVSPAWRPKFRSNHLICHIDVSAFLAVMFALLYLFMAPSFFPDSQTQKSVDLAKVGNPSLMRGADREDALIVAVERDGKVFLGIDLLTADSLPARIRKGISNGVESRVYIKADARAKYGAVKEVLDAVRASGVENIAFLTDQRKSQDAP